MKATTRYQTINCLLANLNNIKRIHATRWIILPLLHIPRVNNIPKIHKIKKSFRNCEKTVYVLDLKEKMTEKHPKSQ